MKKAVFWDVVPCRNCVKRRFGGTYRLHFQGRRQEEIRELCLLDWTQSVAPALLVHSLISSSFTLKMEAIRSSETLVNRISTRRHIPEDGFLHSHRRENLKSYELFDVCFSCLTGKKKTINI
jgi:hypothetical protein